MWKVFCCHCFPISERGEITLWKVPRLRLFALTPASLRRQKLPKEALNIFIVNTLVFHFKDQSVNVGGGGVFYLTTLSVAQCT